MKYISARSLLVILGCSVLVISNSRWQAHAAPTPQSLAQQGITSSSPQTYNNVNLQFDSSTPDWAEMATTVMLALEEWRGKVFTEDLAVSVQTDAVSDLAGTYDYRLRQLTVTADPPQAFGTGGILHEMFHALQDQSFGLEQLQKRAGTPDRIRAVDALIDGEAMLAVSELMNYNFKSEASLPVKGPIDDDRFHQLFLHCDGMEFIQALRDNGGWNAVDNAFRHPPLSTSAIYHPQRYLAGDRISSQIDLPVRDGERLDSSSILGEYEVRLWLARSDRTRKLLDNFKDAYVTDTLAVVSDSSGQQRHRWAIAFSSIDMATQVGQAAPLASQFANNIGDDPLVTIDGGTVTMEW